MGARCNPTPPACSGDEPCGAGQLEVCLNQCVTPATEGQECSPHPCDGSGLPPFDPGLLCTETGAGRHVCLPPTSPFEQLFCRTSSPERHCPTGLYCRGFEDAANPDMRCPGVVRTQVTPADFDGVCTLPSREGQECDGNWDDLGACRACEPGTECRSDIPGWSGTSVCVRNCDGPGDCPCPSDRPNVLDACTPVASTGESYCTNCVPLLERCDPSARWGCCDAGAACVGGPTNATCCLGDEAPCSGPNECCGSALCASDGACHACTSGGEQVDPLGPGCCVGSPNPAGLCPTTCFRRGNPVAVAEGATCGSGTCTGTYDCDRQGGTATCVIPSLPPETFDCEDNDCDGRVDEGTDRSCRGPVAPSEAPNFAGCPDLNLPGQLTCRSGSPVCSVTQGWCAWDQLGSPIDRSGVGADCFSGGDSDCSTFACLAGEWCCQTTTAGRPFCQQLGTISGVPIDGFPHPPPCWLPDQRNTTLLCPAPDQCMIHGSDCGACTADSDCGFCQAYGVCLPGNDAGPANAAADCGVGGWRRDPMMCGP